MAFPRATAALTVCLAIGQLIGWATTFSAAAVIARPISEELGFSLTLGLTGASAFLIGMAGGGRLLAPLYARIGAGPILVAGSLGIGLGLLVLALAQGLLTYFAGWALIGIAGAASLAVSANTLLTEHAGRGARQWIVAVMLISGLSASLGIPMTAALSALIGWRGALIVYAGLNLLVCLPVHLLAMRLARSPAPHTASDTTETRRAPKGDAPGLYTSLMVSLSLVNAITWGFSVVVVEVLRAYGFAPARAVLLATLVGFAQLAARFTDFTLAGKAEASKLALFSAMLFPFAPLVLLALPNLAGALVFVLVLGFAGGVMTVARATVPLELFDPATYGAMASRLALPMNLTLAAAPFVFGLALEHGGPLSVMALLFVGGLLVLIGLARVRRLAYGTLMG